MASIAKRKRGATGPTSAQGKARASENATRHGALSSRRLLSGEDPEEYAMLLSALTNDLRPVGFIEQHLADQIVAVCWRKRRFEGAEHQLVSTATDRPLSVDDLKKALGLDKGTELADWMLNDLETPSASRIAEAVELCSECDRFDAGVTSDYARFDAGLTTLTAIDQVAQYFPFLWACLVANVEEAGLGQDIRAYLKQFNRKLLERYNFTMGDFQLFAAFVHQVRAENWSYVYWDQNRDRIIAARHTAKVNNMLCSWDLDRSHRYHTMLDNQLSKLLREFREARAFRLSSLDLVDGKDEPVMDVNAYDVDR